ncbi:MAG: class I SAM-dependent methyltransferase [Anaerolineae bacterium]|nr:class I SAM-dependent methyltransferase [Anaerolineae bacterium]
MISTLLFTWLQGANFYFDLHKQAVESLPVGNGELWLDIGCGPGLVTRLAAERGYRAIGLDTDPQMIAAAKRIARRTHSSAEFQTGDFTTLPAESAQVVSAASLLAVLPDREAGLRSLWRLLRPGGTLLIVEPTNQMTSENAARAIQNGLPPKRIVGLRMWANARQGNIVSPSIYGALGAGTIRFQPLLQGLVGTWAIQKSRAI